MQEFHNQDLTCTAPAPPSYTIPQEVSKQEPITTTEPAFDQPAVPGSKFSSGATPINAFNRARERIGGWSRKKMIVFGGTLLMLVLIIGLAAGLGGGHHHKHKSSGDSTSGGGGSSGGSSGSSHDPLTYYPGSVDWCEDHPENCSDCYIANEAFCSECSASGTCEE